MAINAQPKVFNVVPGNSADTAEIQDAASSTDPSMSAIFPPIYQTPLSAGGKAPERTTFNTLFKEYGEHLYYLQRGGVYGYDATLDYGKGATVYYNGSIYTAVAENGPSTDAGAVAPDNATVWQKVMINSDISDTYATKASIVDDWYAHLPINNAATHNCFYRGKDLTAAFDSGEFSEHVADGSFTDIFPGDFITKNVAVAATANAAAATYTIKFIVADLDWYLNRGDQNNGMASHHVIIIPETAPFNSYMNSQNVTTGGYTSSYMNKTVLPLFANGLTAAFGAGHILPFRSLDVVTVNNSLPSGGMPGWQGASIWGSQWQSCTCHLMNESMVYGTKVIASSGPDEHMTGAQLSAFRHNQSLVWNRQSYWLSDVASSSYFALVGGDGPAHAYYASGVNGVRPFALLA